MSKGNVLTYYKELKKKVMESVNGGNVWIEKAEWSVESFLGYVHLFSEIMRMELKSTDFVACPVYVVL